MRDGGDQALATQRPAVRACHVGFGPGFIDEHQPAWVDPVLIALPSLALAGDVRPVLFGGPQAFF